MSSTNSITFLMILDQVRADILYKLIQTNQMPYFKKYIYDRGAVVENCFTCFPTNTMPGHIAILTGTYSDKHHISHMRFWNRSKLPFQFRDYSGLEIYNLLEDEFNPDIKMLYEYFDYSEAFTTSNFAKGADYTYLKKLRTIIFYLIQKINYKPILKRSLKTFLKRFKQNHIKNMSEILYVLWLPISDLIGHSLGPESNEFTQHLIEIDEFLFKILFEGNKDWPGLVNLDLMDSTYFIITADHGSFTIKDKSELITDLRKWPLSIQKKQISLKDFDKYDLLVAYTDGFANLYVRNPDTRNWMDKIQYSQIMNYPSSEGSLNLINSLLEIPTVSHVFVKDDTDQPISYLVLSSKGTGKIKRKMEDGKPLVSYQIQSDEDPLEYNQVSDLRSFLDGNFYPFDQWLPALSKTQYPVLLDQVPRIFDCDNSGDILFMGKEGYSFSKKKEKGTHDTGTAICTRVPLIIAGPSVKPGSIPTARTVDIVPTILHLLNKDIDFSQFDGRILSEIIKS